MHRRAALLAVLAVLVAGSATLAEAGPGASTPTRLLAGSTPDTTVFPSDEFTVADPRQLSGRRIDLPVPHCDARTSSRCDETRILNTLDGFDVQPRIQLPFSGPIDLASVTPATVYVDGPDGPIGLTQLVWDPLSTTLSGVTTALLREDITYHLVVTAAVRDIAGRPIAGARRTAFTTESATSELDAIRRALDDGSAYRQSGISNRRISFVQNGVRDVFAGPSVLSISRGDQTSADPNKPLTTSDVPDLARVGVGRIAFGSFLSPQFATRDAVIPQVPTRRTPPARGAARLGVALLVPAGTPPPGGWPVAVYGPGFTRSHYDLFVSADLNAAAGIATIATDPLGHDFGPRSQTTVTTVTGSTTFLSYGRGHDLDGDGVITDSEGSRPTDHKTFRDGTLVSDAPSPEDLVGLRDGLIQTAADNMALVRAIQAGVDVDGDGRPDLARGDIRYYGLSFGAIYGTMLLGTDPSMQVGLLSSAGGPVVDIARLGFFRDQLAAELAVRRPSLRNGGPGLNGFTESIPGPDDPPVTAPYPGAIKIQQFLADATWAERAGSPEAFAPLIRLRPRYLVTKRVEWQTAYGDHTVPNVTAGNIYRAGHLFDRVTYYRNDKTPTRGTDPHPFLADPTLIGREPSQLQLTAFLASDGATVLDPDGPLPIFEVPIADPHELTCLHYPEPQTGQSAFPPPAAGSCPAGPPLDARRIEP